MKKGNKSTEIKFPKSVTSIVNRDDSTAGGLTANSNVKEFEELVAQKDSILALLSHDLRSPLAKNCFYI